MTSYDPTIPEVLLSRRDVAARLTVSVETVKRREREGLLPAVRFNSRLIRYRLKDVEKLIEEASKWTRV